MKKMQVFERANLLQKFIAYAELTELRIRFETCEKLLLLLLLL